MRYACLTLALLLGGCASAPSTSHDHAHDHDHAHHHAAPHAGHAAAMDAAPETAPPGVTTARIVVTGLSCPLCAESITKSLKNLAGVTDATLDLETGVARVTLDADKPATRSQMLKAVDWAGFTVVGFAFGEGGE